MKKILLPTDFSKNSQNAITYALQLFAGEACSFYLINTYTPAVYQAEYVLHSPGQIGLGDIYQSNSLDLLEELKQKLEEQFPNPKHRFYIHSAFNTVVEELKVMVEKEEADLIVMGTQGATGAKEILFGTHTVHVIRAVHCPVLVIPTGYSYTPVKEILFPTDFEPDFEKTPLQILRDIARTQKSQIEIMHVSSGYELTGQQTENRNSLLRLLDTIPYRLHDLPSQELIPAINSFKVETPLNLLVMVRNRHSFLEKLFIEPVVKKIAFHVDIPLLVLPPAEVSHE